MPPEPTPPNPQQTPPTEPQQTPQPEPKPNKAQERINQLFGQKKEAEERVGTLEAQNEQLRAQLLGLQEQVALLREQPPAPPADPYSHTAVPKSSSGQDLTGQIKAAVQEVVGPIFTQQKEQQEAQRLFQQQTQSWQTAAADAPELNDQSSPLYQAAQQIWEGDPSLRSNPNGPYLAAMVAKGMLGSAPVPSQAQKAAAATPGIGGNASVQAGDDELTKLESEYAAKMEELRAGGDSQRLWPEARILQNKIADIRERQQE